MFSQKFLQGHNRIDDKMSQEIEKSILVIGK
jgi:hypothetical protein